MCTFSVTNTAKKQRHLALMHTYKLLLITLSTLVRLVVTKVLWAFIFALFPLFTLACTGRENYYKNKIYHAHNAISPEM